MEQLCSSDTLVQQMSVQSLKVCEHFKLLKGDSNHTFFHAY